MAQEKITMPKSPDYKLYWKLPIWNNNRFSDGRQAQLLTETIPYFCSNREKLIWLSQLARDLCLKTSCEFHVPVRSIALPLVWSIYPGSPEKLTNYSNKKSLFKLHQQIRSWIPAVRRSLCFLHDAADESTIYLQKYSRKWKMEPHLWRRIYFSVSKYSWQSWGPVYCKRKITKTTQKLGSEIEVQKVLKTSNLILHRVDINLNL